MRIEDCLASGAVVLLPRGIAELARRKALWAERKADEAAASDKPWALRNLRLYQNMASKFWSECFTAERSEAQG